ncbi:unnamed protein product [Hymenolepis diminuta]|uniref:Uncharacterized protein n=1 Tax=Hymenolepis diminuta TaxID=6216 RepID=A0A3P6ZMD1_HYMDI|nr:unnamed protein product [Hymenolepis diminuta]
MGLEEFIYQKFRQESKSPVKYVFIDILFFLLYDALLEILFDFTGRDTEKLQNSQSFMLWPMELSSS